MAVAHTICFLLATLGSVSAFRAAAPLAPARTTRRPCAQPVIASAEWVPVAQAAFAAVSITGAALAVGTAVVLAGSAEFMLPRQRALERESEELSAGDVISSHGTLAPSSSTPPIAG